ncbi:MAG: tetratricopeptide repeat protein [Alphaproteobacteria bacterium]
MDDHVRTYHWRLGRVPATQHGLATRSPRYERAIEPIPSYDDVLVEHGASLLARGELDAAIACYRQALRNNPRRVDAHRGLGQALHGQDRFDDAIACFKAALALDPGDALAHHGLGAALLFTGKAEEAAPCFERAIRIDAGLVDAHYYLAIARQLQDRLDDAVAHFRSALALRPAAANVHNNLGSVLMLKGSFADAEACYRRAVEIDPHYAQAHLNLGNALNRQGKGDDAQACYAKAMAFTPDEAEAQYRLGVELSAESAFGKALQCLERALALEPHHFFALSEYVNAANRACMWKEAQSYREALLEKCQWPQFNGPTRTLLAITDDLATCRAAVENYCNNNLPSHSALTRSLRSARPRIRLAYLSADFREHATAYLTAELFECHDRSQFELHAISFGPNDHSPMRQRLESAFEHFVDVRNLSDFDVARTIRELGIDISVALMGYGRNSREGILPYRAAPIQVNYLIYPGTLGAPFLDYVIVDPFVVPSAHQRFFAERLVHLPECYQVNDTKRLISDTTPTRKACGLPDTGFVFCSFNNSYKITPEVFDVWMRLLKAVPGSVLWQLRDNDLVVGNLRREATARGVDPDRLVFAPRVPLADHLARHRLADLFIDTLPYNAHTTASDALWAGLPLVTCAGRSFQARVAGSLLKAIGLPELITDSLEAYEALALRLATNPRELAAIREKLARNRLTTPLFDTDRFRRHLEAAYREMWRISERGEEPRPFAVPAESH